MKIALCFLAGVLATSQVWAQTANFTIKPLKMEGVENLFQLSDKVYSGSSPEGEIAFAGLKKLGIKTIITVDGTKPDVETARKFGLRYVHLPIGYDGVPTNQAVRLIKAAETFPQPIYVHCHHGMHRGPAGAAVICEAMENWTPEQAISWMKQAGTAANYAGLYKSVAEFRPPSTAELKKVSGEFQEKTEVSPLVDAMIEIDGRFDNLKLIQKSGYQPPVSHPDLSPAHEALLLNELFKELLRTPEIKRRNHDFQIKMMAAEKMTSELYSVLGQNPVEKAKAEEAFRNLNGACAACHKAYRN